MSAGAEDTRSWMASGRDSTRASGRADRKRSIATSAAGWYSASSGAVTRSTGIPAAAMSGYVAGSGSWNSPCLIAPADLRLEDRTNLPIHLPHHRPVSLGQLRAPAPELLALHGEVDIPALEEIALGAPARSCDARGEIRAAIDARDVRPLEIPAVDQEQTGGALGKGCAKGARDARAPREADEDRARDSERGEQIRGDPGDDRRPIRLERQRRRLAVTRCVRREHAQSMLFDQDRRDLVRVQAAASEPIPVENRRPVPLAPLADEQRDAAGLDGERLH